MKQRDGLKAALPYISGTLIALSLAALCEYSFGRALICRCGYIKLWHGDVWSSENSQHLTDWYTFSHIIHGFALYYVTKVLRGARFLPAFLLALIVETSWEIVENSGFIIQRYRESTVSLDYFGDSIINSVFDILAMVVGFRIASSVRPRVVVLLTVAMELGTAYFIRDNLTLNILMLVYEFPAIKQWQMGR